jgi:hypothetical protein
MWLRGKKEFNVMMRKGMALAGAVCGLLAFISPIRAGDGSYCEATATCGKTVCCPTTEEKKVEKRYYTSCKEEFCPCSILGIFSGKCGCGKPKTRKDLILKIRHCECCVKKCVPVTQPACEVPCAPAHPTGCVSAPAAAPAVSVSSWRAPVRQTAAPSVPAPYGTIVITSAPGR